MSTDYLINNEEDPMFDETDGESPDLAENRFKFTIEPVVLVQDTSVFLADAIVTILFMERTCTNILHYDKVKCSSLQSNNDIEDLVQPYAAGFIMYKTILTGMIPAFTSGFLGPWSDSAGRKPLIMWPTFGCAMTFLSFAVLSCFPNIHPGYLLLAVLPYSISGGFPNLISAAYCYISDISSPQKRSFRLSIMESFLFTGILIGLSLSPVIFHATQPHGYIAIFTLSATLSTLTFFYVFYRVSESIPVNEESKNLKSLFKLSLIKEMVVTCLKKRMYFRREIIILGMLSCFLTILHMEGEGQVTFLFTRLQLGWTITEFTYYSVFNIIIHIIGTVLGSWILSSYLKIPDSLLAILAFLLAIGQCVIPLYAKHNKAYLMYISAAFGALKGLIGPALRSIISRTVPIQDLGKVFALNTSIESLAPILAGPLYVLVYKSTLSWFPGFFFVISAILFIIIIIFLGVIGYIEYMYPSSNETIIHRRSVDS